MAGILDGQPVNATASNAAWLAKNGNDSTIGVLGLNNAAASSGPAIENAQGAINVLIDGVGGDQYTPATAYPAVPSNTITAGTTHQQALIDLAGKFSASAGHAHSGADGDGGAISFSSLSGTQLIGYAVEAPALTSVSGSSADVTTELTGQGNSYNSSTVGVVTNDPYNYVPVFDANGDSYIDASGDKVYGRLTCAPATAASPTAWTLSFYVNEAGTETPYSFAASSYIGWFYQQLFTEATRPVYSDVFVVQSDQVAGVVPNATTTVYGTTQLGNAAPGAIASAGASGTANGRVANADHTHQGVASVAASGSSALYGAVVIAATGSTTVTQSGQTITINSPSVLTPGLPEVLAVNNSATAGIDFNGGVISRLGYGEFLLTSVPPAPPSGRIAVYAETSDLNLYRITAASGVTRINTTVAASGNAQASGDIVLAPSGGITLAQSGSTITIHAAASGAAVNSLAASGNGGLTGAVVLAASGGLQLSQAGQVITVYAPTGGAAGVTSFAASGQTGLTGAVTISASGSVTLTQSGQDVSIYAPPSGSAVNSIAASGSSALTGAVTIAASGGATVTQSGQVITVYAPTGGSGGGGQYVVIRDEKTSGTDGGGFTSGGWRTRDLTTLVNPSSYSWVSLSSNQFTLTAGTYLVEGFAEAYKVSLHKTKIYNVTDATDVFMGSNALSTTTAGTQTGCPSFVKGFITISGTKTFELQHQCASTFSGSGRGNATGWGTEVYAGLTITKIS